MKTRYFQLFLWGFLISFLGSLPLGTLNVTVTHLAVNKSLLSATYFAVGSIFIEIIIVRIALILVNRLEKLSRFFYLFQWISFLVLLSIAVVLLIAANDKRGFDTALPYTASSPILSGIFLSAINPLHIPFWLGWSAILTNKKILVPSKLSYNIYVLSIGLGTATAFGLYAYLGKLVVNYFNEKQYIINGIVGVSLLLTAIVQLYRIFYPKQKEQA